ncbi:MAG: crossover junction endodeoxyribonuclease RuvC [Candidatus Adiutrix sp.]|jgi:crossover junction endodeoxyribonuclease RuvC|nr:crossover junction endodeoxyribonuclease RuvC [Candidatus Adiutrix sp.]
MTGPAADLILGLDPGSRHTGYGLILTGPGGSAAVVTCGRLSPPPAWPLPRRLAHLHQGLTELMAGFRPGAVAVEDIFTGRNIRSAVVLAQARGVALLAAAQGGAEIFEYAPREVKNAVAGYGQAEKAQVARMVAELLNHREPLPPDAADALAVALCHAGRPRLNPSATLGGRARRGGGWRGLSSDELAALNYRPGKI